MTKRKCSICDKTLSEYNKEDICFCHQPGMIIKEYAPKTCCTSYEVGGESDPEFVAPMPGESGYNDFAFDAMIIGVIDKSGKMYVLELGHNSQIDNQEEE
ncbi:MAG: hypothetical protein ACYS32_00510 [Planctomycetota bacterium]|jgi:hypothetical protein